MAFNALFPFTARTRVDPSKSGAMLQLIRPRIVGIRIIVEPFARLPPVPPRHHHPLQQRRGSEPPLLKLVIHHVSNVISRIQPNEIEQSERTHGISTSQFHGVINILDRSHAFFKARTASSRYGTSSRFTMNPVLSEVRTGTLPSFFANS